MQRHRAFIVDQDNSNIGVIDVDVEEGGDPLALVALEMEEGHAVDQVVELHEPLTQAEMMQQIAALRVQLEEARKSQEEDLLKKVLDLQAELAEAKGEGPEGAPPGAKS